METENKPEPTWATPFQWAKLIITNFGPIKFLLILLLGTGTVVGNKDKVLNWANLNPVDDIRKPVDGDLQAQMLAAINDITDKLKLHDAAFKAAEDEREALGKRLLSRSVNDDSKLRQKIESICRLITCDE